MKWVNTTKYVKGVSTMSAITSITFILSLFCFVIAFVFQSLKEKGTRLISGFNTLPKAEQAKYNKKKLSLAMRNQFFLWGILLLIGAVLSFSISDYFGVIAVGLWFLLVIQSIGSFEVFKL